MLMELSNILNTQTALARRKEAEHNEKTIPTITLFPAPCLLRTGDGQRIADSGDFTKRDTDNVFQQYNGVRQLRDSHESIGRTGGHG